MIPGIVASRRRTWPLTAGLFPILNLEFEGASGSANFIDETGQPASLVGSPTFATSPVYNGASSGIFNGSNQALSFATTPTFDLGTGDWRMRLAFYPTNFSFDRELVSRRTTSDNLNFWSLRQNVGRQIRFFAYTAGSFVTDITTTGLAVLNAWNVIDIRRTSGVVSANLNGGTGISGTNLSGAYPAPAVGIQVGWSGPGGAGTYFAGNLDSLLIEKA